ncbi:hypothetical protein [uncultured Kriegella sp.]|uniref:DUF7793 family protein n=1 Tax=uncultured Kriegella sp. TaxID=1798910 RepID=UPI0030DC87F4|tara:strand:- start:179738 stop:180568 length:831 start_codon:yes stop_codon:yes gene_type:complete
MKNIIQFDGVKFWMYQNIIHCEINKDFDYQWLKGNISRIIPKVTRLLSNGKYLPLLIDLTKVSNVAAIKIFVLLSPYSLLNKSVLSWSFLARSAIQKMILLVCRVDSGNYVSSNVYKDIDKATRYCSTRFKIFSAKNTNKIEMIIYEHATFSLQSNGILFCKISNLNAYNKLDYKVAQRYLEAIFKLSKGEPLPIIVDLRDAKGTFSIEAARLLSKSFNSGTLIISEAYVVNSLPINLLVNSYKRLFYSKIPFAIFKNVSKAEEYSLTTKMNVCAP